MRVQVVGMDGRSAGSAAKDRLHSILSGKLDNAGKPIQAALLTTTRNHFTTIYPGSQHYSPSKVQPKNVTKDSASVDIDVPGVTRAYHSLDIKPKFRKNLTIPVHGSAYGKKAGDFDDLFVFKNRNGNSFLARNQGGSLVLMFFLAKSVHQRKDSRLMPSDGTYAENVFARLIARLSKG